MTIAVDLGRKATKQTDNEESLILYWMTLVGASALFLTETEGAL